MQTTLFQLDAFTNRIFTGNPSAVMPLADFLEDAILQAIAAENNLSETAFLVPCEGQYRLRWFTPTVEVALCGHATLASAAVVMEKLEPGRREVIFLTASGPLSVKRLGAGYSMNLPSRPCRIISCPAGLAEALGVLPQEVASDGVNYLALLENEQIVRGLTPDVSKIKQLDLDGVIVTASGDGIYDFVSRYFTPAKGINEDPVTGSAHCALAPYWSKRLGKNEMRACQVSSRGGEIGCRVVEDRVELEGHCVFYLEGKVEL